MTNYEEIRQERINREWLRGTLIRHGLFIACQVAALAYCGLI